MFEERQVVLNGVPDDGAIEFEILADDLTVNVDRLFPGQARVETLEFGGNALRRLAHDLDLARNRVLHHGAGCKLAFGHSPRVTFELFDGIQHVAQMEGIILIHGCLSFLLQNVDELGNWSRNWATVRIGCRYLRTDSYVHCTLQAGYAAGLFW